jgi:hypothetical protein
MVRISATAAAIVYDGVDLSDWDDQELIRGQRRNRNGGWQGRKPRLVPAALTKELNRRRFSRAFELLNDSLVEATKVLLAIAKDKNAANKDRLRAIEIIYERALGKPQEHVQLDIHQDGPTPWQRLMVKAIVGTVDQADEAEIIESHEGDFVEGEVLDDTVPEDESDPRVWPRE